jgi:hypothetical protein
MDVSRCILVLDTSIFIHFSKKSERREYIAYARQLLIKLVEVCSSSTHTLFFNSLFGLSFINGLRPVVNLVLSFSLHR